MKELEQLSDDLKKAIHEKNEKERLLKEKRDKQLGIGIAKQKEKERIDYLNKQEEKRQQKIIDDKKDEKIRIEKRNTTIIIIVVILAVIIIALLINWLSHLSGWVILLLVIGIGWILAAFSG